MEEDPRLAAYARLLVERCIDPRPGWQVLVQTTSVARPLAEELSRLLAERGAYALTRITFGAPWPVDLDWIEAAPRELAATLPPLEQELVDRVDASIFVLAPELGRKPATTEDRRAMSAHVLAYRARGRRGDIPHVRCDVPCEAFAQAAGLDLAAYEDVFYDACLRDWDAEGGRMRPVLERFDRGDEVRIVGEGTDLRLSLAGRSGAIDDGHLNVPGGEVFYSPVEDSAEGEIVFDVPGVGFEGVRLVFRGGEVVEAAASVGQDRVDGSLATDDGACRLGEFGIGCNEGITRPMRNVLFDEKMAGTIHLALGDGFPQLGGQNRSGLHWDLVKDLRGPGGELWLDGELVQRDGVWL
jgi:aminopeptidase